MVNPIPKWVWKSYAQLWQRFKGNSFTFGEAQDELKDAYKNLISVIFHELKNSGWLESDLDEHDSRKRRYILLNPTTIVKSFNPVHERRSRR